MTPRLIGVPGYTAQQPDGPLVANPIVAALPEHLEALRAVSVVDVAAGHQGGGDRGARDDVLATPDPARGRGARVRDDRQTSRPSSPADEPAHPRAVRAPGQQPRGQAVRADRQPAGARARRPVAADRVLAHRRRGRGAGAARPGRRRRRARRERQRRRDRGWRLRVHRHRVGRDEHAVEPVPSGARAGLPRRQDAEDHPRISAGASRRAGSRRG